jgi:23S rRNA (guanosine2251-2'-O)-methyltransferase
MSPPRRGSGGGAPRGGSSKGGPSKGGPSKGGPAKKGARKPLSPAAKKAVESKRVRHAEASVRKADRPSARKAAFRDAGPSSGPGGPGGRSTGGGRPTGGRGGGARGAARSGAGPARGLGGDQVEGRQAVRELLLAGRRRVREILVAEDQDDTEVLQDIVDLALDLKVPVREVTRTRLFAEARTESPQGVVARAGELPEADLDDLARRKSPQGAPPFLLAVDGVTDPGNLGALLRSAECAGVTGVVLPKHRAVHVTPTVTKAAAGAVEYLPMALVGGLPTALRQLRESGVWVIGLDAGGDTDLFDLEVADQAVCLVMGAEGKGLSRLVRERCDAVAGIPLLGQLASLNVSAAGALACFEVTRRRLASRKGS